MRQYRGIHNGGRKYGFLSYNFATHQHEIVNADGTWPVISETVGQATGLKDKHGEMIFGGDICRIIYSDGHLKKDDTVKIEWISGFMTFCPFTKQEWDWYEKGSNHFKYCYEGDYRGDPPHLHFLCQYESYELEIIGNIHQNASLLREKE